MTGIPPEKWHHQLPPEQWEAILHQALQDHRKNPSDNEALKAIKDANDALNAYDNDAVDQTKLSSIPNDLSQVGGGMMEAAKGIPTGIGQMLHHAGQGEVLEVGKDIAGGLASTAKGALAPWELAMRELGGETVNDPERNKMLHDAGGSLVGLEAMALPGQVMRGVKALRSGGMPSMPRPLSGPSGAPETLRPKGPNVSTLDENSFMDEYRKGTMTPDQADPYGLNDLGNTSTLPPKPKGPIQYPKYTGKEGQGDNFIERAGGLDDTSLDNFFKENKLASDHPLHDILSPEQINQGPKPLSPTDIDAILGDILKPKRSMGTPPELPPAAKGKFSTKSSNIPDEPIIDEPMQSMSAADFLGHVPGRVGRYAKFAKLLTSLPDATAVRNKALTGALKGTIISGMKPDSTSKRK